MTAWLDLKPSGKKVFLGCKRTRLMHSFICFQATGRVDSRGASAIWTKAGILKAVHQWFTKPLDLALVALLNAPVWNKILRCSFETRPSTRRRHDQYCILRVSAQCKGKFRSRLIPLQIDCMNTWFRLKLLDNEGFLSCKCRRFTHSFFCFQKASAPTQWRWGHSEALEKTLVTVPQRDRETIGSSTCGSPAITPVDAPAASSASKLNKSTGTSGPVSYLSKSTAWLHDSIWDFRTQKSFSWLQAQIRFTHSFSAFKHPLNLDHLCTFNEGQMGWDRTNLQLHILQLSWRKSIWHGPARHLMISSAVTCSTSESLEKACYYSNPSVGEADLTGGKVDSQPKRVCKKPKHLKLQRGILKMTAPICAPCVVLESSMPRWPRHNDFKYQQNHLPIAKELASTCEHETNYLNFC